VTPRQAVVAGLLVVGVAASLLSCVGLLVMRDVFDRLHYSAPVATVGAGAIGLAVLVEEGVAPQAIKALLMVFLVVVTNAVLTHATARAARMRQFGHWVALRVERVDTEAEEP
jgi:monovalent cation/proton antiporter MnhG/PhaG subunit